MKVLLTTLFTFFMASSFAQCDLIFTGQVIDDHNEEPLIGAIISLNGEKVVAANSEGYFTLSNLCPNNYNITIQHIDCEDFLTEINLQQSTTKTFFLEHHEEELEKVLIEYQKKAGEESKSSKKITAEEIQEEQARTFGDLLTNAEGVTLLKTGSTIAKPVLNGLHSQRVLTINNGIRQEGQQWGREHAPEIDPYTVQSITVVKGAGTVQYGADGLGGAVVVKPSPLPDSYGYKIDPTIAYQTNGQAMIGNLSIEGKQNVFGIPLSFQAQGSLKKAGNLKAPDYYLDNTGTNEQNFSLRAGYIQDNSGIEGKFSQYNTELGILSDSHIGNEKDLLAIIANGKPFVDRGFSYNIGRPRQEISHEVAQISAYKNLNIGKLKAEYGRQYNSRSEFDRYDYKPGLRLKTETYTGKVALEHSLSSKMNGEFGTEIINQDYRADGYYLIPEYKQFALGIYAFENYEINSRLFAEAGLRYDYKTYDYYIDTSNLDRIDESSINYNSIHDDIGHVTNTYSDIITGSAGVVFDVTNNLKTSTYVGYGVRQPLPNELFSDGVHHGTALFEVGNPNLTTEKAISTQLNFEYQNTSGTSGTANFYRNSINNYIYLVPSKTLKPEFTIRGYFPVYETIQNDVTMLGVDYSVQQEIEQVIIKTTGSFLKADDNDLNTPLFAMPSNRLKHSGSYKWNNKLKTTLELENIFQQKRVPAQNIIPDYVNPPKGYHLLNASASYTTDVNNNPLTIRLKAENIFNTTYKDYLNVFRYYADDLGTNIGISINYSINN